MRLRYSLLALLVVGLVGVSAYFIWFRLVLGEPLSEDTGVWGAFGDYIGGLMNPLVAACALYWLTMSVRLQKDELAATRSELAASRAAQEEQARTALFGARINSLSLRLNAVTTELGHLQSRLHYVLERMDTVSSGCTVHTTKGTGKIYAYQVTEVLEAQITTLREQQYRIVEELKLFQDAF